MTPTKLNTIRFLSQIAEAATGTLRLGSPSIQLLWLAERAADRCEHIVQYELEDADSQGWGLQYLVDDVEWMIGQLRQHRDALQLMASYALPTNGALEQLLAAARQAVCDHDQQTVSAHG